MEREMTMYHDKVFGEKVSEYGIENGYLDYRALAGIVGDMILNNQLMHETNYSDWEVVNDHDDETYLDVETNEYDDIEIYQYYIISERGYEFLSEYTDEVVFYNNVLDIYLWGITHYGTSWDYVLTDIKLVKA